MLQDRSAGPEWLARAFDEVKKFFDKRGGGADEHHGIVPKKKPRTGRLSCPGPSCEPLGGS